MDSTRAIIEAKKYDLEKEVGKLIDSGMDPEDALWEFNILVEDVEFVNLTPHTITLNSGISYPSQGIARVSNSFTDFDANNICTVVYGDVTGLPNCIRKDGFIVSVPGFVR